MDVDPEPPKIDDPLFSMAVCPGGLLYYLDVYPGRNGGSPFLKVTHFMKDREGNLVKHYRHLYPKAVKEAIHSLEQADAFLDAYNRGGIFSTEITGGYDQAEGLRREV